MMAGNYAGHATKLNNDLLFMLSLGSLEAFHSNVLAMLAESHTIMNGAAGVDHLPVTCKSIQSDNHRKVFLSVMNLVGLNIAGPLPAYPGDDKGRGGHPEMCELKSGVCSANNRECSALNQYFYVVRREWNNMDLAFFRYKAKKVKNGDVELKEETLLGVVEMKIKALPDPYQLERYSAVLDKKRNKASPVHRSIVSLQAPVLSLPTGPMGWGHVSLKRINSGLHGLLPFLPSDFQRLAQEYENLTGALVVLGDDISSDLNNSSINFQDIRNISNDLSACRMSSVLEKSAYGYLGQSIFQEIARRLQRNRWRPPVTQGDKDCVRFKSVVSGQVLDAHFYVDLSHGTGMCGFAWQYKAGPMTLRLGIQIQGTDLKLYVSLAGGVLNRVSPIVVGDSIETLLLWDFIAPQSSYAGVSHPESNRLKLHSVNSTGPRCAISSSLDYVNCRQSQRPIPISLKTTSPRQVKGVQALFHGYSSSRDHFSDLRYEIDSTATINQIATFASDYLEWLLFSLAANCQGGSPFQNHNQATSDSAVDAHAEEKISGEKEQEERINNPYRGESGSVWERITQKIDGKAAEL